MKAVLIEGNHLGWRDVADPIMKEDEVLIKIEAAALNRADILQREGNYPPPPGCPEWMGLEVAGTIQEIGAAAERQSDWKIGDKVCALLGGGGYAEYVTVRYDMVMPIPKGLNMVQAAALPEAFCAAYLFLRTEADAKPGETLLMQAGASGLASVVIPMAKSLGMRVITTVRSSEFVRRIRHLEVDRIVDCGSEDLVEVLKEEKALGHPVNIAIDCLGDSTVGECMPYMAAGGRWIMIATLAGDCTQVNMRAMYANRLRLIGTNLRSRSSDEKVEIVRNLVREIWPAVEAGRIRPTIYKTFPIQQAEEAQAIMVRGEHVGKIVLTVGNR